MVVRFVIGWSLVWAGLAQGFAAELSAAVARRDLTPPLEMKAPLGGYGARMNAPALGVHDRIFAKALLLTDGHKRFVVVSCDLLGLAPPLKAEILRRLAGDGWTADQILMLPSHSHASIEMHAINPNNVFGLPQVGIHHPQLFEFTVDNFVELIRRVAAIEPVPVRIGTGHQHLPGWNRNRRADSDVVDSELTLTRVDTLSGDPLAVLVNFTAHPTFMSEREMMFSAGWPGALQRTLESLIGSDVTVLYYNGAEGDQSPTPRGDSGDSRWEQAARYGTDLAIESFRQWQSITTARELAFAFHLQTIELPQRCWHPDFMETGGREYGLSESLLRDMLPRLAPAQTKSGILRLGELVIMGIPGEMSAELGLQLKSQAAELLGVEHPVIGGLANEWISYILTPEAYRSGRYEASVSFYGESLGPTIVSGVLTGLGQLQ